MLLRTLMAWLRDEPRVCSMVPIPDEADEEARRAHREREDLVRERRSILNKIDAILATLGVKGYRGSRHAGIMVRDRESHRIRGWQGGPCLQNRSSPETGNRSLTSMPSYEGQRPLCAARKGAKPDTKTFAGGSRPHMNFAERNPIDGLYESHLGDPIFELFGLTDIYHSRENAGRQALPMPALPI
jgi:hypothetical protein